MNCVSRKQVFDFPFNIHPEKHSLEMFKKMGMNEAMLGVDTQNPNGAFDLYEKCGFRSMTKSIIYEKALML